MSGQRLSVVNVILSTIVIAMVTKYPILREDRTTLFMLSLTLSDLANGCTTMPIGAAVCLRATPNSRRMVIPPHASSGVFNLVQHQNEACYDTNNYSLVLVAI